MTMHRAETTKKHFVPSVAAKCMLMLLRLLLLLSLLCVSHFPCWMEFCPGEEKTETVSIRGDDVKFFLVPVAEHKLLLLLSVPFT